MMMRCGDDVVAVIVRGITVMMRMGDLVIGIVVMMVGDRDNRACDSIRRMRNPERVLEPIRQRDRHLRRQRQAQRHAEKRDALLRSSKAPADQGSSRDPVPTPTIAKGVPSDTQWPPTVTCLTG